MIQRIHRFGDFRLVPATRSLHRGDEELTLPAKAFDCTVYLVEHRERAVGRDELIAAVWDKIDVSDGVLGQTILVARCALDDTCREQTVIRTLLRFGYQWVAPTETIAQSDVGALDVATAAPATGADGSGPSARAAPGEADPARAPPQPQPRPWRHPRARMVAFDRGAHRETGAISTMVLVLPVAVSGDGEASLWMRLGVMDLIAGRLRSAGQGAVAPVRRATLAAGNDRISRLFDAQLTNT